MLMAARRPGDVPDAELEAARHRAAGWFRLFREVPVRSHPWLEKLALGVFALCILGLLALQQKTIRAAAESVASPVAYVLPWHTDRRTYHAGDVVRFSYRRTSAEGDLVVWHLDAWENEATGAIYPEPICGRYVAAAGSEAIVQVRSLPDNLPAGTYRLRGWVTAQTSRRSRPAGYVSEPFRVVRREPGGG